MRYAARVQLRDLGEFGLIERIARRAARSARAASGVVLGIGDDAALFRLRADEDAVVTTDALVEGVHFRFRNEDPRVIGRRALAVNLADLAAMGARPLGFTLALAAPPDLDVARIDGIASGLLDVARRFDCPLVGGNVTRSAQTQLALTAVGAVRRARALRRDGARRGDRLFVTGCFGAAALERARAERGLGRVRRVPAPRLRAGRAIARLPGAGACIDVSDGLLADLQHLLEASGVGAEIDPKRVPRPRGFGKACAALGLDPDRLALCGGEDYELLFSLRARAPGGPALARRLGLRVTEIGHVTSSGRKGFPEGWEGWRHF
jgi:thiamine-monophosphate kinase